MIPEVIAPSPSPMIYRTKLPVRIWHWINAFSIFVMLMSGMMIFNAHPHLYWGHFGANFDQPWLTIGNRGHAGYLWIAGLEVPTTGVLGYAMDTMRAFPPLVTLPGSYNLAGARQIHFAVAWMLGISGTAFFIYGIISGHLRRDLGLKREERSIAHLWHDIKEHAQLRFPKGEAARAYNPIQKIAYIGVIFVLIPVVILTGLTMSPTMDAAWPWLTEVFGGRQSARSIHFLCAAGFAGFIVIHLLMVVLAGPINEMRSMVTGWYRLPKENAK